MKMIFKIAIYLMVVISAALLITGWIISVLLTLELNPIVAAISTSVLGLAAFILCLRFGMFVSSKLQ